MDGRAHESEGIMQNLELDDEGRRNNLSGKLCESHSGVVLNSQEREGTMGDENTGGFGSNMDSVSQGTGDGKLIHKSVNNSTTESHSNSEDKDVLHRGIVVNTRKPTGVGEENKGMDVHIDELRSTEVVIDIEKLSGQGNGESSSLVVQASDSSKCVGGLVLQTVIVINPENMAIGGRNGELVFNDKGLESSKLALDEPKTKVAKGEKQTCAVEKKFGACGGGSIKENWGGESVCRICHLSSEGSVETSTDITSSTTNTTSMDLVQLGCGCKDELGIAHVHCAEAWFKLRGNRICEICGETAANITGVGDQRFMDEWNGRRSIGHNGSLSDRSGGCWRGQPFCNFLMACLVIAFVLPWFFRVNMF